MEIKKLTRKQFMFTLCKMPHKIKNEFMMVMMDKYETIEFSKVSLDNLQNELQIIIDKNKKLIQPFIKSIQENLTLLYGNDNS